MSAEILQRQRLLSQLGQQPGPLDGIDGPKTKAALTAFLETLTKRKRKDPDLAMRSAVADLRALVPVLSVNQVRAVFPDFDPFWIGPLNASMVTALITSDRLAAYLSQLGHESAGFKTLEEYASGRAYENRSDLGNVRSGDGMRYKGRGPIQLTGRANYRRFGSLLGIPLEGYPVLAKSPGIGFQAAALYWLDRSLNYAADTGDLKLLTKRINGGLNGFEQRKRYYFQIKDLMDPKIS